MAYIYDVFFKSSLTHLISEMTGGKPIKLVGSSDIVLNVS